MFTVYNLSHSHSTTLLRGISLAQPDCVPLILAKFRWPCLHVLGYNGVLVQYDYTLMGAGWQLAVPMTIIVSGRVARFSWLHVSQLQWLNPVCTHFYVCWLGRAVLTYFVTQDMPRRHC